MSLLIKAVQLFYILLLFSVEVTYARMYQWIEPDTGTTQLSGKPPTWYRGDRIAPRTLVFYNGRLIDDTSVEVSDEVRRRMRQQAFIFGEKDKQKAQEKITRSNQIKQKYVEKDPEQALDFVSMDKTDTTTESVINDQSSNDIAEEASSNDTRVENKTLDELRRLISKWGESRSEDAEKAFQQ